MAGNMTDGYSDDFWQSPPCEKTHILVLPAGDPYRRCRKSDGHGGDCDLRPTREEWERWLLHDEVMTP